MGRGIIWDANKRVYVVLDINPYPNIPEREAIACSSDRLACSLCVAVLCIVRSPDFTKSAQKPLFGVIFYQLQAPADVDSPSVCWI